MQFVKHFAPPPPRKTLLLDWREGNRRAVLCWDRASSLGRRYGPAGSSISGSRLKQTVYTAKKKGKAAWSICWLYGDTAENATASSICRRTPHYLENWCSSQSADHGLLYTSSLLFTQTVKWGEKNPQHISTAAIKIAKSIPCFG